MEHQFRYIKPGEAPKESPGSSDSIVLSNISSTGRLGLPKGRLNVFSSRSNCSSLRPPSRSFKMLHHIPLSMFTAYGLSV